MIKNKHTRKTIAVFFLLNFLSTLFPYSALYANNNGPNAPEASGFEPVNATDMVNLSSGDMAYVLPLLDVDGFPVTLSYHAGIPMDMDASWVGLGWNINTGSIARGVVSTPDDWNNGKSMKYTYYYYETESYTVNIGVGFKGGAEVGVGLSWGSNKSLSGSVYASAFGASASIDTDGNYSVGIGSSAFTGGDSNFGGSLSVSGNVNSGDISVGLSAGYSKGGMYAGLGVSISSKGFGAGVAIGKGNSGDGTKASSGIGGSIGSFSAGDMNISSSGFYIPIQLGIFNFGFGYQRQKISYKKGLNRYGYGSLYQNSAIFNTNLGERNDNTSSNLSYYDNSFEDLQRRNVYGDIYDQELAQHEIDFIQDYKNSIEKINFTFAGYDSYGVNASGISGNLSPIIGQNTVLIGEGFEGNDTDVNGKKMKVFYHNSYDRETAKAKLNTDKNLANKNLYFAFDGQIMDYMSVGGYLGSFSNNTAALNLGDFAKTSGSYKQRPKSGSYVEVFTNTQLDLNPSLMLKPNTVHNKGNDLKRVNNLGYEKDGIGGYKITAADGKIYHFAQPVYQYEKIEHNYIEIDEGLNISGLNSSSKREATPYATHWLLTAITGPDFIDKNGNNFPDNGDYGYWLRLEHGQWSSAYTWRTPYADSDLIGQNNSITDNKEYRKYSTYNEDNINKSDAGHFLQGRKDLYYLDKIVSREQTAYFVKDIRKDGLGTDLDYNFTVNYNETKLKVVEKEYLEKYKNNEMIKNIIRSKFQKIRSSQNLGNSKPTMLGETILSEEYAKYDKEFLLRLDKIIIEKNTNISNQIETDTGSSSLGGIQPLINHNAYGPNLNSGRGTLFSNNLPQAAKTHKLHQTNNVIDINDFANYDYSKALKVIKFTHNYELAKKSPNSIDSNKGRLTLDKVHFYGRGTKDGATESELYDYMPPYIFRYKQGRRLLDDGTEEDVVFSRNDTPGAIGNKKEFNKKDSWGFIEGKDKNGKTLADTWSLSSIETPQGSTIDIEYEEDDYYVEAFSRRYWSDYLKFNVRYENNTKGDDLLVDVYNYNGLEKINFNDYFKSYDKVYFDFWTALTDKLHYGINYWTSTVTLDIKADKFDVVYVDDNKITIKIPRSKYNYRQWGEQTREIINRLNCFLKKTPTLYDCERQAYTLEQKERGFIPKAGQNQKKFTMSYKLLATKSPTGNSGGGLKVAKITVNDEAGAKYETTYDYRVPNNVTNGGFLDKSSGITSFYPVYGTTYVPYQNELPGPGVMYEWVTMKAKGYDASGNEIPTESTRYHYYTLQPNFHIFDPGFTMKDNDGDVLFKATIKDVAIPKEKITAKDITIETNLAKIGQLISVEQFNSKGHLLSQTKNSYTNKVGFYKETFTSMKSIYDYSFNDDGIYSNRKLKRRALSKSTKIEGGKILNKVTTVSALGTSSVSYSNQDPYLGSYRTAEKTMADGTKVKETRIPAYDVYSKMGSKIIDPTNKNMLVQEAMNSSSVKTPAGWRTTNASITTWNNDWIYRGAHGTETTPTLENEKIWRKHKNYVWRGDLDEYGTYGKALQIYDFKWGVTDIQNNSEWQNVSEITRYTHYSMPVETRDINNNYAASKMDYRFSKTIAAGNAKYTEMYYSGAEEAISGSVKGGFLTKDEFTFENATLSNTAHTGKNAIIIRNGTKAFKLMIDSRDNSTLKGKKFRPGKYKVSYWLHTPERYKDAPYAKLKYGTNGLTSAESVKAGEWTLKNYFIDVKDNTNLELCLTNEGVSSGGIVDDFRIHPVASSMNSYVYDDETDELRYILDANNLATEFKYDKAGRLCKTFKEVVNDGSNKGGFKQVKQYNYRYKKGSSNSSLCGCCESNGGTIENNTPVAVNDVYEYRIAKSESFNLSVLNNDYDPNSLDDLTINNIITFPVNGTVSIVNNEILYTPNNNYYGQDSFTYNIKDNGVPNKISNTATVNIKIVEDTFKASITKETIDVGHKACTSFKVTTKWGSGSFSYLWTIKDAQGNIITTNSGGSDYYGCISCRSNEVRIVSCNVTDIVSGKTIVLNPGGIGPCNGGDGNPK